MRNDCFALPAGVDWVPMDEALGLLRGRMTSVVGQETIDISAACGKILAQDVCALRANPPAPNSAVDGYGFAGGAPKGVMELPLQTGRAAAGQPSEEALKSGHAIRILTGAILPEGVDTVVLQEDVAIEGGRVAFHGPLKQGANTRKRGEDVLPDDVILQRGHVLRPQDLALLAAVGQSEISVYQPLKIGVFSNGDEVIPAGKIAAKDMPISAIYDANRPMLLAMIAAWGFEAVDLGHAPDDRAALRAKLDAAAQDVDAIITSGGVSAGDEDHVSAVLQENGSLNTWRIAVKPGRPLALGMWNGTPVFGLPGNPVAAFVCALLFARPAFGVMAGGVWSAPLAMQLPAEFTKIKKPGRREFLRARIGSNGGVEVFASEGSGRISGLSWADGLVELSDEAQDIARGDLVRYLPFSGF